jgi:hypothetical protein
MQSITNIIHVLVVFQCNAVFALIYGMHKHKHPSSLLCLIQDFLNSDSNKSNKMQVSQVYCYLKFMCGSTCLGRLPAHHQEHTTALGASAFTVGVKRLERCWSWSGKLSAQHVSGVSPPIIRSKELH